MAEIYQIPENGNNNGWNIPFSIPIGGLGFGNNYGYGNGFFGSGFIPGIFGGLLGGLIPGLFNGNGFGMGGNGMAAAASLGAQATANNNTDLIMQAINGTDSDVRLLATTLNADVNEVRSGLNTINLSAQQVGANVGLTGQQVINAIQQGNMNLAQQLCKCCCDNQLAICQQTNAIQNSVNDVNQNISATRAAQQLSDCQQTYALTETMNRNYQALDNKIDALESNRKDREITALTAKVATLESQNFTTGVIAQAMAPVNAQLAGLAREVDDIKCKLPNTVNVEYPNLQVFNATPYVSGGFYGQPWNNGFNNTVVF